MIFVARVLRDSGEGWGTGPARVAIEEALQNVPAGQLEAEIDTSAGTSCYYRLKAGERYVIVTDGPKYSVYSCTRSFELTNNEYILEAMRSQLMGGSLRIVGRVLKTIEKYHQAGMVSGALVVAESPSGRFEALSDGMGRYVITGMPPGIYELKVSRDGYLPDRQFNRRFDGILRINPVTKQPEDEKYAGTVAVANRLCAVWDLALWPAGIIKGTVRDRQGKPLSGVTVQAFGMDQYQQREPSPLRTTVTAADGTYTLTPLPRGAFVVGVNAESFHDSNAFSPTLYSNGGRVELAEVGSAEGIDLVLPPPRAPATLLVKVLSPEGAPYPGAQVRLDNLQGVQRFVSTTPTDTTGEISVPVYLGETYTARASSYRGDAHFVGTASVEITGETRSVTIVLQASPI
ncbi:MAG: carboxypeptidase-like regulatory domain-containing protein [Acidobacteria bacterium]|nr:carboxypeptidase-like regulatory domain-containing protein [Acidobacteriota bacterium]